MKDDEQAIRALIAEWMRASAAGDAETVLSLMTDDVVFLVAGQEPFGKAAFAAASKGMSGMRFECKSDVREIEVCGTLAWARSYLEVTITPPDGTTVRRKGYTLSVFRKAADGRWQLARDANLLTKAR
jgi:uncharacterized protein (TIGR02246 family)